VYETKILAHTRVINMIVNKKVSIFKAGGTTQVSQAMT